MYGVIDKRGTVVISFNIQGEKLLAPGDNKQWLPCEICHRVDAVETNVISHICDACYKQHEKEFQISVYDSLYAAQYEYAAGYHD